MEREILLSARHISKSYGKGSGRTVALEDASIDIYKGEMLVILGSSGSGKSTLLNLIGGMDRPDTGEIMSSGKNICSLSEPALADYRRNTVGFVFQSYNLIQELSVLENVELTADTAADKNIADRMLDIVGLSEKKKHYPPQLSGGEQQRVSIARALAKKSRFLLCDEPTGALDYQTAKQVLEILEQLVRKYGKTVILVTHAREIAYMADRVIKIKNGRITENMINEHPTPVSELEW